MYSVAEAVVTVASQFVVPLGGVGLSPTDAFCTNNPLLVDAKALIGGADGNLLV